MDYVFTKTALLDKLTTEIRAVSSLKPKYVCATNIADSLTLTFNSELTSEEEASLSTVVTNHSPSVPTATSVGIYLDTIIFPFITNLIRTFAAENIAMGITYYGKTGHVLGLFTKSYDVNSNNLPVSLKNCFDTGSLYEAIKVIQHLRDNPTEFDGLSPFITDARLHAMKNSIETCLGVPLT